MEKKEYVCFDKRMTNIVKGFAIIFMMLLHCYGERAYDVPLDYSHLLFAGSSDMFKICVGMFCFMVGYGYAFSRDKDLKYSWKHIKKLLISFWVILFVFTLPLCYTDVIQSGIGIFLYNLVGIDSHYNYYSWFVYFYIFAMIVMPFVARFINRKPVRNTAITVVATVLLSIAVHEIPRFLSWFGVQVPPIVESKPLLALFFSLSMTPITVLGYLFAHERYYERINIGRLPNLFSLLVCLFMMALALTLHHLWSPINIPFQFDFFYAPLMIGAIAVLFSKFEWEPFRSVMAKLGEVSVYMWFFHALFFTKVVSWFYQPAITIFSDINLVVLWTIVLTFFVSWLIKMIVDRVINLVTGGRGL